ncbi:caspase family protein, partial [Candidatus Albibeggiatoa sp. nov. BB20]|uniref:caspase family protein n=1 Tax=Candidatus Albibeggiatoa sp. nov. BB20 TaxID=3162723 RepID=UPI00336583A4
MGSFDEVALLLNPTETEKEVRLSIAQAFSGLRTKNDVALLYFSGHGIKDYKTGHLYLAAIDVEKNGLERIELETAICSVNIHRMLKNCPSKRQIVILDCCFSSAFAEGLNLKSGDEIDVKDELGGKG